MAHGGRPPAQRGERVIAHLAVHDETVPGLEVAHRGERDRAEVAVGGHPEQPLHGRHRRAGRSLAEHGLAGGAAPLGFERPPRVRADLAVDQQPVLGLEAAHGAQRRVTEVAVGAHAQQSLEVGDVGAGRAVAQDAVRVDARPGLAARRERRCGQAGRVRADRGCGHGQGDADALDGAPMPGRRPPSQRPLLRIAPQVLGGEVA